MSFISSLEEKVSNGEEISFNEAMELSRIDESGELKELIKAADRIRDKFNGKAVDICSIMNAKAGKCTENCKFCAQSAHYKTNATVHGIVSKEEALALAKENKAGGVNRFSLVTSGRRLEGEDFDKAIEIYKAIKEEIPIHLCASLGSITYNQLLELKEAGITMYHHNLETSREYYTEICTTHPYDERINTIENVKKAGLKVCSGGIIGMGESMEDRVKLAFTVKELGVTSIPVNVLNPVKGTPLEAVKSLSQEEILKTIAIFRFVNKAAYIRLAGGRCMIKNSGKDCLRAGANATISGNYLTTSGNKIIDDINMVKDLKLAVKEDD